MLDYTLLPLGAGLLYVLWDLGARYIAAKKFNELIVDRQRATELAVEQLERGQQQIKERMTLTLAPRAGQLPRRGAS